MIESSHFAALAPRIPAFLVSLLRNLALPYRQLPRVCGHLEQMGGQPRIGNRAPLADDRR
jgi:hypothetical protein